MSGICALLLRTEHREVALGALADALRPFGSLQHDPAIAGLVLQYVDSRSSDDACALLRAVRSFSDMPSNITIGTDAVDLITPTSHTVISVIRGAWGYDVEVHFQGPSTTRAEIIMTASAARTWSILHAAGVPWRALEYGDLVPDEPVDLAASH